MINKNIIVFMPSIEGGGVEKNLFIITNYISKKFKKISVITISKKYKKRFNKNINFISFKSNYWDTLSRRKKYFLGLLLLIKEFLKRKKFSVFCCQANIYCTILCKLLGIKIIIRSNSSPSGWSKNFIKNIIFKKVMSLADCIIVNSLQFKKELKNKFKVKSVCIYNPLNYYEIIKLSKQKIDYNFFKKKHLNLINIGRLVDQKDQITILKASKILKDKNIKFKLLIIGSGILKKNLQKFIIQNKLANHVRLLKFTNNPYPFILKSEVFLLSSLYEGLPNVLLEALTLNKFVISSRCPTGPNEILDYGKGGLLFKCKDYKELSKKIIQYLNKKKMCKKKLKFARTRLSRFNYDQNLEKYSKLINYIL